MSGGGGGNTVEMTVSSYDLFRLFFLWPCLFLIDLIELGNCKCDLFRGPGVRGYLLDEEEPSQRVPADPHF